MKLVGYFDGGMKGGKALGAAILKTPSSTTNFTAFLSDSQEFKSLPHTSNVAEYLGLHLLLSEILHLPQIFSEGDSITIYGDSQLVIRQIQGDYVIRSRHLHTLNQAVSKLLKELDDKKIIVKLKWIPREQNLADALT